MTGSSSGRGRGPRAGDYSSKVTVCFSGEPAEHAVRRILAQLISTLEANVAGTVRNLDTEFLHDLRCDTPTRTCIGQLMDVLPVDVVAPFARVPLVGHGHEPCRDLDVFLLEIAHRRCRSRKSMATCSPSEPTSARGAGGRTPDLVAVLDPRVCSLAARLEEAPAPSSPGGELGAVPVAEVASKHVCSVPPLSSCAAALEPNAPAAELHRLRIDAKKLRYSSSSFEPVACRSDWRPGRRTQTRAGQPRNYHDACSSASDWPALPTRCCVGGGRRHASYDGPSGGRARAPANGRSGEVLARLATFASPNVRRRFVHLVQGRGGE